MSYREINNIHHSFGVKEAIIVPHRKHHMWYRNKQMKHFIWKKVSDYWYQCVCIACLLWVWRKLYFSVFSFLFWTSDRAACFRLLFHGNTHAHYTIYSPWGMPFGYIQICVENKHTKKLCSRLKCDFCFRKNLFLLKGFCMCVTFKYIWGNLLEK